MKNIFLWIFFFAYASNHIVLIDAKSNPACNVLMMIIPRKNAVRDLVETRNVGMGKNTHMIIVALGIHDPYQSYLF